MVLLAELSTDILLLVLSYLPPADKATISRVCKWLQRFAEPMLYADIRLTTNYRYPTHSHHLHVLLLQFLTTPALASHVKRFQTNRWRERRSQRGPRDDWLNDPKYEIFYDLARKSANPGDEESWANMAGDAGHGIYQTLLISQFPNLTELSIGHDLASNFESVGKMLLRVLCSEKATDGLSKFQHLKRVDLCVDITQRDCSIGARGSKHRLSHLLPFFYLPSIEHLRMVMSHYRVDFSWPATPPCTQSLTSLSLKRSSASEALLARILAVTPNLKCLEYGFICEESSEHGPTSLCAEGLGKALAHVKTTLEQLTISVHFVYWYEYRSEDFPSRYGIKGCLSLHDYESLVLLEVPIAMLLGYRPTPQTRLTGRLPPRIRQLYLRGDMIRCANEWKSKDVLGLLRDHLSQYRAQTADLETLRLKLDWDDKSLDDFRNFCEGVHLTLKLE